MKKQLSIYIILLSLLGISCEEVIEINLNSSAPVIVAEGVLHADSVVFLNLSYSTDYFTVESAEKISNAVVCIADGEGNVDTLESLGEGRYELATFHSIIGRTYTMSFSIDGKEYEANSTLMAPTRIISVDFEAMQMGMREQIQDEAYYAPRIWIRDNPDEDNYYSFVFYVDGKKQEGFYLTTDRGAKDGVLEYAPLRMAIEGGNEVYLEVYSIDEATYTYYSQLDDLSGDMMNSSTPYNPQSNFGAELMGFFSAFSMDAIETLIEVGD